ncbi:hypothetical protein [Streptomyces aidingensis]|uniref:Uncharacterized protein n=1 Tax=Streptomyces aidingensis TaxID=910347 RepID=A0A1I1M2L2_9ACTN|nr:hypothetical protein [Streptomyces aidingensis]SFC79639.1 hypothetical protein SAMN05421773_10675 [Streptomyces aidingensis]
MTGTPAMAGWALALSAGVPGALLVTRNRAVWSRLAVPAAVSFPLFVLVHAAVVLSMAAPGHHGPLPRWPAEAALAAAAVLFWLPVVGGAAGRHALGGPGRCLYLFLAMPLLDLPAVVLIAAGHAAAGLAMIVGMLPVGLIAAATTWRWIGDEERATA